MNYLNEKFNSVCNVIETDSKTLIQIMDKNASKEKSIDEISRKYKIGSDNIYIVSVMTTMTLECSNFAKIPWQWEMQSVN